MLFASDKKKTVLAKSAKASMKNREREKGGGRWKDKWRQDEKKQK